MDNPHGTIICPRCQTIQCGLLDLVCDGCNLPLWEKRVLKHGLTKFNAASQQASPADPVTVAADQDG